MGSVNTQPGIYETLVELGLIKVNKENKLIGLIKINPNEIGWVSV